jgi:hypothetical protein
MNDLDATGDELTLQIASRPDSNHWAIPAEIQTFEQNDEGSFGTAEERRPRGVQDGARTSLV